MSGWRPVRRRGRSGSSAPLPRGAGLCTGCGMGDRDVPSYFKSLEHLLRYSARPPVALERLSVTRDPSGRIARVRYELRQATRCRDGHATGGCCDANHANQKPRSHDTSRIAWAKLMAAGWLVGRGESVD